MFNEVNLQEKLLKERNRVLKKLDIIPFNGYIKYLKT